MADLPGRVFDAIAGELVSLPAETRKRIREKLSQSLAGDEAETCAVARLRTFNAQPEQIVFSLQSLPGRLHSVRGDDLQCTDVIGCPWCRRPVRVEVESGGGEKTAARTRAGGKQSNGASAVTPLLATRPCSSYTSLMTDSEPCSRFAHISLLYGVKQDYLKGACVLGWSLRSSRHARVLMVTADVTETARDCLRQAGWTHVVEVSYLTKGTEVTPVLFKNPAYTRFGEVFTKLELFRLSQFKKVLFLDLDTLVRDTEALDALLETVAAPAALVRGNASSTSACSHDTYGLKLGDRVPYQFFWEGYERKVWKERVPPPPEGSGWKSDQNHWGSNDGRSGWGGTWDTRDSAGNGDSGTTSTESITPLAPPTEQICREHLRSFEQANGINAGVMLLEPSLEAYAFFRDDLAEWYHPAHFPTYMPEQEYLGRVLATLDFTKLRTGSSETSPDAGWHHLVPRFNFEVDKSLRIPFDFSDGHREAELEEDTIVVLHYSGATSKPWAYLSLTSDCATREEALPLIEARLQGDWEEGGVAEDNPRTLKRIARQVWEWLAAEGDMMRARAAA